MEQSTSKRKRTQNTTNEQYELYLETMENDIIMRSGTIDPTVEDDYINKKWQELANKLNCIGQGPVLSKDTWKRRFKDWKNATRAKYRRMRESQLATGGGIGLNISLNPLEERGLEVWGKVAVTGTPLVTCVGGLGHLKETSQSSSSSYLQDFDNLQQDENDLHPESDNEEYESHLCASVDNNENNFNIPESSKIQISSPLKTPSKGEILIKSRVQKKKSCKYPQTLGSVAEELKEYYKENTNVCKELANNVSNFSEVYERVQQKRNDIEERRLAFEIAKYIFENKTFNFSNN